MFELLLISPAIILNIEVLPAPFGPERTKVLPGRAVKLTFENMVNMEFFNVKFSQVSIYFNQIVDKLRAGSSIVASVSRVKII